MTDAFLPTLLDTATHGYRRAGHFAYHFARGKLGGDPIFRGLLEHGLLPAQARVLDLGCGQALLAAWLLAARRLFERGQWPQRWSAPPAVVQLRGIELMSSDVARARQALRDEHPHIDIVAGDIRDCDFGEVDVVTIFDVLHYLDPAAQEAVLQRVHAALAPGGRLIARIGDAGAGLPFHVSQAVDRCVTLVRGHRLPRLHCRPLRNWVALLERLGFAVSTLPMSQGTPFANVMLIAVRQG